MKLGNCDRRGAPLLLRIAFDKLLVHVATNQFDGLFLKVMWFTSDLLTLPVKDGFGLL